MPSAPALELLVPLVIADLAAAPCSPGSYPGFIYFFFFASELPDLPIGHVLFVVSPLPLRNTPGEDTVPPSNPLQPDRPPAA